MDGIMNECVFVFEVQTREKEEKVIEPESANNFLVFVRERIPFSMTRSDMYPPVTRLILLATYKRAFNSPFCGLKTEKRECYLRNGEDAGEMLSS